MVLAFPLATLDIYMHVHMYIHMGILIHVCAHVCVCVSRVFALCMCVHVHVCSCVMLAYVNVHACAHTYLQKFTCVYTCSSLTEFFLHLFLRPPDPETMAGKGSGKRHRGRGGTAHAQFCLKHFRGQR